jgi:hypothetical protein
MKDASCKMNRFVDGGTKGNTVVGGRNNKIT